MLDRIDSHKKTEDYKKSQNNNKNNFDKNNNKNNDLSSTGGGPNDPRRNIKLDINNIATDIIENLLNIIEKFLKEKFGIEINNKKGYVIRLKSLLIQYIEKMELNKKTLEKFIFFINKFIIEGNIKLNIEMDYIDIMEYVFVFINNMYDTNKSNIIINNIIKNSEVFTDMIKNFINIYKEINSLTNIEYPFNRIFSILYHYYKHKNFNKKELTPEEYVDIINNRMKLVLTQLQEGKNFYKKDGLIININYQKIFDDMKKYIVEFIYEEGVKKREEILIFSIDKEGNVCIISFYEKLIQKLKE
ncbi:hypothetical protein SLOPH_1154 [Spraguea lophii 42_110]|uniref:Uncharacterized protein n=1 Tax=Spraguea lophii (strain 42_110) TaxID=1358809 RepID=S7XHA8_SPRLO|nr:hypothetical protein SLOPH_1154 [Spraguea lophii 42_110]